MRMLFSFTIRFSLVLFVMTSIMAFITRQGSAEWYISLFSAILNAILFSVSVILLKKNDEKRK